MFTSWRATNQIAKFDPRTHTLVSETNIGVPGTPSGLAIKPTTGLAALGCRPQIVFWDLKSNSLASSSPKSGGADAVIYNAHADRFFAARSGYHRGPVMGIFDGSGNFITNIPTTSVSHEVGYDQTNGNVYTIGGGLIWFKVPV